MAVVGTLAVCVVALAQTICGTNLPEKSSGTHFVRDAIAPFVADGSCPGMVSILCNGGRVEADCIGFADVEQKRPMSFDAPYMVCSQTKGMCGIAAAILVEECKISLDDPISWYLPAYSNIFVSVGRCGKTNFTVRAKNILTLRHLLTHTSGLPFESPAKERYGWASVPLRIQAEMGAMQPLRCEPGTRFAYSNWGMDVAASVLEKVAGERFEDFLLKRLFKPLGLVDTTFNPTDEQLARSMSLYRVGSGAKAEKLHEIGRMPVPHNGPDVFPSAGAGLWSTPRDFVKVFKMLYNRGIGDNGVRILKADTVINLLETSQLPEEAAKGTGSKGYSLGFHIDGTSGWYGHGGAWGTNCRMNPSQRKFRFLAQQIVDHQKGRERKPFMNAYEKAAQKFLKLKKHEDSDGNAFVGRTKE